MQLNCIQKQNRQYVFFLLFFTVSLCVFSNERTVTIESAHVSEYTPKQTGEYAQDELLHFSGDVIISIVDGQNRSKIFAEQITYNKTQDTLEARGSVVYEFSSGPNTNEFFYGEALLFKIKEREGVFLDGKLVQESNKKDSDPYSIKTHLSARDSSGTFAFKNAVLTTCDAEEPHWTIAASRIWLLPGNEIAILNGIFRVGVIPVLYIPFFYYPLDEMIFHPVFGFRNREGYFVQTTTYLFGRKQQSEKSDFGLSSSLTNFLIGDELKEQRREGLFLRNLDSEEKNKTSDYVKVILDVYSSLGSMVGIDGRLGFKNYIKSVSFSVFTGFSNVLYNDGSSIFYTPFDIDGKKNTQSAWFLSNKVPFRFKTNFDLNIDKKPFSFKIHLPLISDPFFNKDFLDRSEDLNWFSLLLDQENLAFGNPKVEETSFNWDITGSFRPNISVIQPWITNFSISSIRATILFNSKQNSLLTGQNEVFSSERKFFYPELIKPSLAIDIGGTLIDSVFLKKQRVNVKQKEEINIQIENPFKTEEAKKIPTEEKPFGSLGAADAVIEDGADGAISGSAVADAVADAATDAVAAVGTDGVADAAAVADVATDAVVNIEQINLFLPEIKENIKNNAKTKESIYTLKWTINHTIFNEYRYLTQIWDNPEEITWDTFASTYNQSKSTVKLTSLWTYDSNFLRASTDLLFTSAFQEHPWLSDSLYTDETKKEEIIFTDLKAQTRTVSATQTIDFTPFNRSAYFSPNSINWTINGKILETVFDTKSTVNDPQWETNYIKWNRDFINNHATTTTAGVIIHTYQQKLSISSKLKPLLENYALQASLSWPYTQISMKTRYYEKENEYKKMFWDDFDTNISLSLPLSIRFGQQFLYSIEEEKPLLLKYTGSWAWFTGFYTLADSYSYNLIEGMGWVVDDTKKTLRPTQAGLTITNTASPLSFLLWKNRISLQCSIASTLNFNILKKTESNLSFSPTINLKIHDFLDLKFYSYTRNDYIVRYYQDVLNLGVPVVGETNLLIDLLKSFNFFNENDRRESSFKLTSLNVDLIHYLHDWTMSLKTAIKPELNLEKQKYEFKPEITFLVQWKPISDIKTTVKSEKGNFILNTAGDTAQ